MSLKRKKQTRILSFILSMVLVLFVGCSKNSQDTEQAKNDTDAEIMEEPYDETEFLMGTYVSLRIYDEGKEDVLEDAFARVEELEDKLTVNEPDSDNVKDSEIHEANEAAGESAVSVSEDVYPLLEAAAEYSAEEKSGFDYTIGPITDLWRIGFDDARVPEQEEIDEALPLVDPTLVELDEKEQSVFLKEEDMQLDLGAIAKGYIADEVIKLLKEEGVTTAIVDLGGNVVVLGDSPTRDEGGWNVGIQDPSSQRGEYVGAINVKDKSIVTSGIYERYIEEDGKIYHHLMDPETGYPFENDLASVTIISEESIDGDALSTVVFAHGLEDGLDYVNNLEDVEAVFISKEDDLYTSDGITEEFDLTNEDFNWVNE